MIEAILPLEIAAYALPGGGCIERREQRDGTYKWAIRRARACMNREGEWEYEPMPSFRDDDYLARCRYASAQEAYGTWITFNSREKED